MALGQAEQDPDLPRSVSFWDNSNVLGKVQSHLCFKTVAGQAELLAGQVNFRGSFPRSVNNVLLPILHPATYSKLLDLCVINKHIDRG